MTPTKPKRKWLLRLLEFSPLVAVALLVGLGLSIPFELSFGGVARIWYATQQPASQDDPYYSPPPSWRADVEQYFAGGSGLADASLYEDFYQASQESYDRSAAYHNELFDSSGAPKSVPWDAGSTWFDPLREFERQWDAKVYVFLTPAPPMPSLIASALAAPSLLPSEARLGDKTLDMSGNPYPPDSQPPGGFLGPQSYDDWYECLWWDQRRYPPGPQGFSEPALSGTGPGAYGDGERIVGENFRKHGSDYYYYLYVGREDLMLPDATGQTMDRGEPFYALDPREADFQERLQEVANNTRTNLFVGGPVDIRLVPIYPDAAAATRIATQWTDRNQVSMAPAEAPDAIADATGARWIAVNALSSTSNGGSGVSMAETPTQGLVYLATWEDRPSMSGSTAPRSAAARAWRTWQIFVASNFPWFLLTGMMLFAASLVASPAAFIYERRRETQERVLAEMARVQQDAHDKVYNRLSALSKRVSLTGAELSRDVAEKLDKLSEDIRSTVGDLQEILGDANRRTSELAGVSGLAEQLEQVCRAQAARLEMDVQFRAEDALPETPPDVAWHLQCIVEEALTNASKHGGAKRADVLLTATDDHVVIEILDDGVGIPESLDIDALPPSAKGLRGIRTRTQKLGGTLSFERLARGTRLVLDVPGTAKDA